ncbi:MAG: tetratricopeptide repeat protein [Acidobacteriota bacterium]|nr:MAG: tetratricopeptide repeat protein [Acidobacteriota bacterium]
MTLFTQRTFRYLLLVSVIGFGAFELVSQEPPTSEGGRSTNLIASEEAYKEALRLIEQNSYESLREAKELLRAAARDFEIQGAKSSAGNSWLFAGVAASRLGDWSLAKDAFLRARDIFANINDRVGMAVALNNVGLVHARNREIEEAATYYKLAIESARAARSQSIEAQAVENMGIMLANAKKSEQAIENLLKALELYASVENHVKELEILFRVGSIYLENLGNAERSHETFALAKEIARKSGNRSQEGTAALTIARLFVAEKKWKEASINYSESAEIFRQTNELSREVVVLNEYGLSLMLQEDYLASLKVFSRALEINHELSDMPGIVSSRISLGIVYKYLEQDDRALELLEAALPDVDLLGDDPSVETGLTTLAKIVKDKGNPQRSISLLNRAREISRNRGNKDGEAHALELLGLIYNEFGDIKRSLDFYQQAASLFRLSGNKQKEMQAITASAIANASSGDYLEARKLLESGLEYYRESNDELAIASTNAFLAQVFVSLGKYEDAVTTNLKALEYFKTQTDTTGQSLALNNLGLIYFHLGENQKAIDSYTQSLALASKGKRLAQMAQANGGLGNVYTNLEKHEIAIEYYTQALGFYTQYGAKPMEILTLNNRASSKIQLGRFRDARSDVELALSIQKSTGNLSSNGFLLLNLGEIMLELGETGKGLEMLTNALISARSKGDTRLEAYALGYLGEYWLKQKNKVLAVFYAKQAVNYVQSIRASITRLDVETQQAYVRQYEKGFHKLAGVLIDLGRIAEAEQVLAMLKEDEYFEFLRRDGGVSDELLAKLSLSPEEKRAFEEYKKYAEDLTKLGKELGELQMESRIYEVGKFPKQTRLNQLETQILNANIVFAAFLDSLKLKFGERDVRVGTIESGSQSILKELGEPRTVFISTISSEERLNIIVTTSDTQKAYTVPIKEEEVNRLVAEFRSVLRNPSYDPRLRGKALFDVLFPAGVIKDITDIEADTIVWSLDGTLRYVPISALWDGKQFLVERFNNVVVTLASRDKLNTRTSGREKWRALGVGVSKEISVTESDGTVRRFEALTAVPEELCTVIDDPEEKDRCGTFKSDSQGVFGGSTLLDEKFTFQNFRDSLGRFPVVHVASHFHLNAGNDIDSYLLLGGGENRKLSLTAIRQGGARFAGVELLTLSACNTGMSAERKSNGIEIEGFGALAQRSGAKSVLASLWAVADSSTRDLMTEFYRQMEPGKAIRKADALRIAQLTLLRGKYGPDDQPVWRSVATETGKERSISPARFARDAKAPFAHPYYWSPFILIGNWQ